MYSVSGDHHERWRCAFEEPHTIRVAKTRYFITFMPVKRRLVSVSRAHGSQLAYVKPRLTWLMHYRDQVVRRVRNSDERVNTLQKLRFGTKESRQGLAVSDLMFSGIPVPTTPNSGENSKGLFHSR